MLVRNVLPAADGTWRQRPIRVEYTGSLADTPIVRCVRKEIDGALAAAPIPPRRSGAHQDARYDWPRPQT